MRRRRADKRPQTPDLKFDSTTVGLLVRKIMRSGKRSTAEKILYTALDEMVKQLKGEPLEMLDKAIDNVRPQLEVKSRRVGGATYQVPVEVSADRGRSLAMNWLVMLADKRKGQPMAKALATELVDAYNGTGNAIKKRDDGHKMAQANRAFAHYRW
jgi:small subunit ribosomal protein S7